LAVDPGKVLVNHLSEHSGATFPGLFAKVPVTLFRPLASPLCALYWEILLLVYRLCHGSSVDNDVSKTYLLDKVEEHLRDKDLGEIDLSDLGGEEEQESWVSADENEQRRYAYLLLKRLQTCGWFTYEYRKEQNGFVVRLYEYTWRLVPELEAVAQEKRLEMRSLAYPIKLALADPRERKEAPDVFLEHLLTSERRFITELKILRDNIGQYVEEARRKSQVKDLLSFQEEYHKNVVERSYHRFKTSDNIVKFREFILDQLNGLLAGDGFVDAAAEAIVLNRVGGADFAEVRGEVIAALNALISDFKNVDALVGEIDRRNARYLRTIYQKMQYELFRDENITTHLLEALGLWRIPPDVPDVWEGLSNLFRVEVVTPASFYTNPRAPVTIQRTLVEESNLDEKRKQTVFQRTLMEMARRMTKEKTFKYALELLEGRDSVHVSELPVKDDEEMLRLIHLHAYRNDPEAPYRMLVDRDNPDMIHKGEFSFRPCRFVRRSGKPSAAIRAKSSS
jgi:hypothetical protein